MKKLSIKVIIFSLIMSMLSMGIAGCSKSSSSEDTSGSDSDSEESVVVVNTSYTSALDTEDMFKKRELSQEADTSSATTITVESGKNITISQEGVYVISGEAENCTIIVNVDKESKVQLVLDGVTITNESSPAILVMSADKCYVTTTDSTNTLKVTGQFTENEGLDTDAVIYSKDDISFNGTGTLNIESTDNGVTAKDDLRITGGSYSITSASQAFDANDSIAVSGGTFNITANDGFHCENSDDDKLGYIYISGGTFDITAQDDAFQACSVIQIDDAQINATCHEGLEATYIQVNGGIINISASDDGVNATTASKSYSTLFEQNGGELTLDIAKGDTDGVDSNGDVKLTGGALTINADSPFDYTGSAEMTGGTLTINGEEALQIPESQGTDSDE
ncbi:MAG: carbohydrate-binding domain-containing protein [Ruminococcus sp.]|nr:carbohydrate-binding domain-containing protein [Ruminococcus sp.]